MECHPFSSRIFAHDLVVSPCTETHELGEEMVASYLYHVYLYHWLESNDYGRFLADNDL